MRLRVNKCFVAGNVVSQPVLTVLKNGSKVCNVSIAINESYVDKGGERKEITTFVDITAWDFRAERLSQAKVGDNIFVAGHLRQDVWEAEGGNKRSKIKIVADEIQNMSFVRSPNIDKEEVADEEQIEEEAQPSSPPSAPSRKPFRA